MGLDLFGVLSHGRRVHRFGLRRLQGIRVCPFRRRRRQQGGPAAGPAVPRFLAIYQFRNLISNNNETIGKKLDFLIQEMNRETNTIGSKANNLEITNGVIDIKTELEDIREQIQNIE